MKTKSSPIWKYYVEVDDSKARCKVCDKIYSRKGRGTTALKSHLKAMHAKEFADFEKLDEALKLLSQPDKLKSPPQLRIYKAKETKIGSESETAITAKGTVDSDEESWQSKRTRTPSFEYIATEQDSGTTCRDTQYIIEFENEEEVTENKNNKNRSLLDIKKDIMLQEFEHIKNKHELEMYHLKKKQDLEIQVSLQELEHKKNKNELEMQHIKEKQDLEIQFLDAKYKLELDILKQKKDSINNL